MLEDQLRDGARKGEELDLTGQELDADLIHDLLVGDEAARSVRVRGAVVSGPLDLEGMTLRCPLRLEQCEFAEPITLAETIAPSIRIIDSTLASMNADQLETRGDLDLSGCTFTGELHLAGAHIGGRLLLSGCSLSSDTGLSLMAEGLRVEHTLVAFPRGGRRFVARGLVNLAGARIRRQLNLSGASLEDDFLALQCEGLQAGEVYCQTRDDIAFEANGTVLMGGVSVSGQLGFNDAALHGRPALILEEATVTSLWLRFGDRPAHEVNLTRAEVGSIYDRAHDGPSPWPSTQLDGCTYSNLSAWPKVDVKTRLRWVADDPDGYSPQPYEQLAAVYQREGRDDDARVVGIAKERRRRSTLGPRAKLWSLFLGATVAHGYRPSQALYWLVGLLVVGSFLFDGPLRDDVRQAKDDPAAFNPVIYTLDLLIPVISLGQRLSWNAHGAAQWLALVFTVCGWLLTAALLGGIAARRH